MNGISVIIPTLNRGDFLKHTLDCLDKQDFMGDWEIIIVDQSDVVDDKIANYPNPHVRYFNANGAFKGLPEARNFGALKANFDILLYIDDDVDFDSDFVRAHYDTYRNNKVAAVAGGITEKNNPNPPAKKAGQFHWFTATPKRGFHLKNAYWVNHGPGGNYSIRKELYISIGGTDEYLNYGAALYEESEMCLRLGEAGGKVWFNPDAHLWHLAAPSGGCRVPDINKYIKAMVHNRAILISRHLKWYHRPIAILYLLKLVTAYAVSYRNPGLYNVFARSFKLGWHKGTMAPKYTKFDNE